MTTPRGKVSEGRGILWSEIVNTSKALSLIRHKDENPSPWRHNEKDRGEGRRLGVHLLVAERALQYRRTFGYHFFVRSWSRSILLISAANSLWHGLQISRGRTVTHDVLLNGWWLHMGQNIEQLMRRDYVQDIEGMRNGPLMILLKADEV